MLTASREWYYHVSDLYGHATVSPRGMVCREDIGKVFSVDMNYPIVNVQGRKLNYTFMAAEAYWITSGSPLVAEIVPYCKHMKKYSDDGYIFNGAYGPMFLNQLEFVVNTLRNDNESRQAVMTIWSPNPAATKDHRCTIMLQWLIRNGKIETQVYMRSSDAWLGLPYDIFNFAMMTHKVRCWLDLSQLEMGQMDIHMGSAHLYEKDAMSFECLDPPPIDNYETVVPLYLNWNDYTNHLLGVMHEDRNLQDWS